MNNNKYCMISTVFNNLEEANNLIKIILDERLASCCQKVNINSSYWWNGKIENSDEILIQIKTKKSLYNQIEEKIREIHSYDVAEVICFDIIDGSTDFLNWIDKETI